MKTARSAILILTFAILLGTVIVMVSKVPTTTSAYTPVFSTPYNLNNDTSGNATEPDIVSVGSYVYVAWSEYSHGVLFRESPDYGATWYPPLNQTGTQLALSGRSTAPEVSANGSDVYVVWSQTVGTTGAQIVEATSANNGMSFGAPHQISSGSGPWIDPEIASWGSNITVVYAQGTNGSYVSVSTNGGSTWTTPYQFASGHQPHVAMWQDQIYTIADAMTFAVSNITSALVTPTPVWNISAPYSGGGDPTIAAYANNVYAAWESKGSSSIVYALVSDNYGASYHVEDASGTLPGSWGPAISAFGTSAWIALHTTPGGNRSQVYVLTSTNNGTSWGNAVSVSGPVTGDNATTGSPFDVVSSDGTNVYVAWPEQYNTNTFELRASYSANGGSTWTLAPGYNVSQNGLGSQASNLNVVPTGVMASSGPNVFAAWQYSNSTAPGVNNVYFSSYVAPMPTTSTTTSSSSTSSNSTTTVSSTSSTTNSSSMTTSSSSTTSMASSTTTTTTSTSSTGSGILSNSSLLLYAGVVAAIVIIVAIVAAIFIRRGRAK